MIGDKRLIIQLDQLGSVPQEFHEFWVPQQRLIKKAPTFLILDKNATFPIKQKKK